MCFCVKTSGRHLCDRWAPKYRTNTFIFIRTRLLTMLHSSLFLGFFLLSTITCGPASDTPAPRWGGGGWGGSTGIIAGGVFPLPCDCLSKCVSIIFYEFKFSRNVWLLRTIHDSFIPFCLSTAQRSTHRLQLAPASFSGILTVDHSKWHLVARWNIWNISSIAIHSCMCIVFLSKYFLSYNFIVVFISLSNPRQTQPIILGPLGM